MSVTFVNIGGMAVSNKPGAVLKTMALGSCVGVAVFTENPRTISLIHIALPDSKNSGEKAKLLPGYFADTAVRKLIQDLKAHGVSSKSRIIIKLAGGAQVMDPNNVFNIGKRNVLAVKKCLWKYNLGALKEDTGGHHSRTVWIEYDTGLFFASCPKIGSWKI